VDARQRVLTAARKKLDATIATQEQWMAEISSLHARQKLNDAVRSSGDSNYNDRQWERTCELIRDIETRVKVEERLLEAEQHYSGEFAMVAEGSDSAEVAMAISDYFELGDPPSIQTTTFAKVGTDDLTN
jgi:hypothetical protein